MFEYKIVSKRSFMTSRYLDITLGAVTLPHSYTKVELLTDSAARQR